MKVLILMGSPRLHGNTAELCKPFMEELTANRAEVRYVTLADKTILPCKGCYACQNVQDEYGCVQKDDMQEVVESVRWADCIVFATPIYSWYCPTVMKSVLDRHYGLNKYYGSASGSLWEGKKVGILATHGYDAAYATDPFETGIKRLCEHSRLQYIGMYSVRDTDDLASFQTNEAVNGAKQFAKCILNMEEIMRIETERLIITEFDLSMAEVVHKNSLDEDNRKFVPDEVFETVEEATETIEYLMSCYQTGEGPLVYPVLLKTGENIGYVQLVPIDEGFEVGYHIAADFTKKGFATEAVKAFLSYMKAEKNLDKVYGICIAENAASKKVLERCGFVKEYEGPGLYQEQEKVIAKYVYG